MGAYGLMSHCPNYEVAGGSVSELDTLEDIEDDIKKLKDRQKDLKEDLRNLDRDIQNDHDNIIYALDSAKGQLVIAHIEGPKNCGMYKNYWKDDAGVVRHDNVSSSNSEINFESDTQGSEPYDGFTDDEFFKYCDIKNAGKLSAALCDTSIRGASKCRSGMDGLAQRIKAREAKDTELQGIDSQLESLKEQKRNVTREATKAMKEAQKEALEGGCVECMLSRNGTVYRPHRPGGLEILGGIATGAIGAFAGYMGLKQATQVNAQLGFPTNPSAGFGWPMGMMMGAMGLYGAINGGMNGSYGCNGGINGMMGPGGLMGYPNGMYPGYPGGGMYPGMMGMGGMPMMGMGGMPMMGMGGMPMMGMGGMPMMGMGGMLVVGRV